MAVSAPLLHDASGPDSGGGLRKIGAGTLILSGTNTYAGATSVEAGTLVLAPRLLDGLVYRLDTSADALDTLTLDASSNVLAWADCSGAGFVFTTNKTTICPVYDPALFGGRGGLRFSRDDNTCCRLGDGPGGQDPDGLRGSHASVRQRHRRPLGALRGRLRHPLQRDLRAIHR
jgi:autotransporter-associated beta strand protein